MKTAGDSTSKSERISLRLDSATKRRIEQAAALRQRSVSSFILSSVLERADDVIHESETHYLVDEDRDHFFEAILNPTAPNQALRDAFSVHEKLIGKPARDD